MASEQLQGISTVTQQVVGGFHPYLAYFPLIFFTGALIADLFFYFGKKGGFKVAHALIILGWLSCIPTIFTGLYAVFDYNIANQMVIKHRDLGYTTGIVAAAYAGLRVSAIFWNLPLLPSHFVGLSVLMVALVSWTSDYGILINMDVPPIPSLEELQHID